MTNDITIAQKQMIEKRLQEFRQEGLTPSRGRAQCLADCLYYLRDKLRYSPVPFVAVLDMATNFVNQFFRNVNDVTLCGRVASNPEMKSVNSGKVCSFQLAVSRGGHSDRVDYFKIELWEILADKADKQIKKGMGGCVTGSMEQYSYEVDGQKRYDHKLKAKTLEPISFESV